MGAGLPATGGGVSPDISTDRLAAYRSLYLFAARYARGRRGIDLGCGTGYGCELLRSHGATSVLGLDRSARSIRFARRRFLGTALDFACAEVASLEQLPEGTEFATAIDLLPYLDDAEAFLPRLGRWLGHGGAFITTVPPIAEATAMAAHRAQPRIRSHLFLWEWSGLLETCFSSVRVFRHLPPQRRSIDLEAPFPSTLGDRDFRFEEIPLYDIDIVGGLSAVFVCRS